MIKFAPSLLAADFSKLGEEARRVEAAGADLLHLDVMDGRFVPNISFGPSVIASLRSHVKLPLDAHIMAVEPDWMLEPLVKAGADIITVHAEAVKHLQRTLSAIRSYGIKAGVALNPAMPLSMTEYVLDDIDLLLVMTVNPGFGGQKLIPATVGKVRAAKAMLEKAGRGDVMLQVDGGVAKDTIRVLYEAGANVFVAGTSIFQGDARAVMKELSAVCEA